MQSWEKAKKEAENAKAEVNTKNKKVEKEGEEKAKKKELIFQMVKIF